MIPFGPATRIFLATAATDMRRGFDGLTELVCQQLAEDPLSGHLFLFTNRRRTRLKVLVWDSSGLWVCAKRLEQGTFHWPTPDPDETKVRTEGVTSSVLTNELELGVDDPPSRDPRPRGGPRGSPPAR